MKYVYLIQIDGTDVYKIGYTKSNPKKRLEALQTGNPFKLVLVDYFLSSRATKIESTLHNRFKLNKVTEDEYKLMGEWFKLDHDTRIKFKDICAQIERNFIIIESMSTLNN